MVVKPTSSIPKERRTIDINFEAQPISTKGRHDPCVALRAVPIAEAMLALVIVDFWMQDLAAKGARASYSDVRDIHYGMAENFKK